MRRAQISRHPMHFDACPAFDRYMKSCMIDLTIIKDVSYDNITFHLAFLDHIIDVLISNRSGRG
jgi:hypothetical protein